MIAPGTEIKYSKPEQKRQPPSGKVPLLPGHTSGGSPRIKSNTSPQNGAWQEAWKLSCSLPEQAIPDVTAFSDFPVPHKLIHCFVCLLYFSLSVAAGGDPTLVKSLLNNSKAKPHTTQILLLWHLFGKNSLVNSGFRQKYLV